MRVKWWRQSNRKHGWVVMWVAGTSHLFTLKHRSASEKGFGSIMASENIILELSVSERLSYFATSSFNAPQVVAQISRSLFCSAPFSFQVKMHQPSFPSIIEKRIAQIEDLVAPLEVCQWNLSDKLLLCYHACMQRRHILKWPCAKTYRTRVLASFIFLELRPCLVKVRNNEPPQKHNCTLLQPFL